MKGLLRKFDEIFHKRETAYRDEYDMLLAQIEFERAKISSFRGASRL